ncbi:hypothetical protein SAMN05443247_05664 [Bradyrhizobium erythrophlei]|jgi:hypothetical protein|nr:hypothetical protein SAMN05443247_05664 [Bradyrhizobium erythrophlei]
MWTDGRLSLRFARLNTETWRSVLSFYKSRKYALATEADGVRPTSIARRMSTAPNEVPSAPVMSGRSPFWTRADVRIESGMRTEADVRRPL